MDFECEVWKELYKKLNPTLFCVSCGSKNVYASDFMPLGFPSEQYSVSGSCRDCDRNWVYNWSRDVPDWKVKQKGKQMDYKFLETRENNEPGSKRIGYVLVEFGGKMRVWAAITQGSHGMFGNWPSGKLGGAKPWEDTFSLVEEDMEKRPYNRRVLKEAVDFFEAHKKAHQEPEVELPF